jgi:GntR family transcriptional regulator
MAHARKKAAAAGSTTPTRGKNLWSAAREIRNATLLAAGSPLLPAHSVYRVSPDFQRLLTSARADARNLGSYMEPEHLLLGILELRDDRSAAALGACGLDVAAVSKKLRHVLSARGARQHGDPSPRREAIASKRVRAAFEAAFVAAVYASSPAERKEGIFHVDMTHLLLGTLIDDRSVGSRVLRDFGVARSDIQSALLRSAEKLEISLDWNSDRPLFDQIVEQVSEAVAAGRLSPGYRLPPIRQFAIDLQIAPGTVSRAYAMLESRGVVRTSGSLGTFVAAAEPGGRALADDGKVQELLRSAVVAAYHAGMSAENLTSTFRQAMEGIY